MEIPWVLELPTWVPTPGRRTPDFTLLNKSLQNGNNTLSRVNGHWKHTSKTRPRSHSKQGRQDLNPTVFSLLCHSHQMLLPLAGRKGKTRSCVTGGLGTPCTPLKLQVLFASSSSRIIMIIGAIYSAPTYLAGQGIHSL